MIGLLVVLVLKFILMAAMWIAWGWQAALFALLALGFSGPTWSWYNRLPFANAFRLTIELTFIFVGMIAILQTWGWLWVIVAVIVYVVGLLADQISPRFWS